MKLYCDSPVVIVNPKIRHLLIECKGYYTPTGYLSLPDGFVSFLKLSTDRDVKRKFSPHRFFRVQPLSSIVGERTHFDTFDFVYLKIPV